MREIVVLFILLAAGCSQGQPGPDAAHQAAATGLIIGVLVDEGIRPILGLNLTLDQERNTTTDAEGAFEFLDVPPGSHVLVAEGAGFLAATSIVNVVAGETSTVSMTLLRPRVAQPYHETLPFHGYVDASLGLVTILGDREAGGLGLTACQCSFAVTPSGPVAGMVLEVTWTDSLQDPTAATEYVWQLQAGDDTAQGSGPNPIHEVINRLDFPPGTIDLGNLTSFVLHVYPDASWPAISQNYDVYLTLFYLEPPPNDWSFLQGDK